MILDFSTGKRIELTKEEFIELLEIIYKSQDHGTLYAGPPGVKFKEFQDGGK